MQLFEASTKLITRKTTHKTISNNKYITIAAAGVFFEEFKFNFIATDFSGA